MQARQGRAVSAGMWRAEMARERPWRATRGAAVGALALTASLAGHALGGGSVPVEAVLLLGPFVLAAGVLLADRELTVAHLVALVLGTQVVVHLTASLTSGHHGMHDGASSAVPGTAMVAAHLMVAVGLAVLLRFGEVAVWRLVALLLASLGVGPIGVRATARGDAVASAIHTVGTHRKVLFGRGGVGRRGPPLVRAG